MKTLFVLALCIAAAMAAPNMNRPSKRSHSQYLDSSVRFPHLAKKPVRPSPKREGKIVGGSECTPHAYPHQVYLLLDGKYFCGGEIIDAEWVMTAAHCCDGIGSAVVGVGQHDRNNPDSAAFEVTATELILNELWDPSQIIDDICVIRLPSALELDGENVDKVNLPADNAPDGAEVTLTGWGRTSDDNPFTSSVLKEAKVTIIPFEPNCGAYYQELDPIFAETEICFDPCTDGVCNGSCNGDSGGPMTTGSKGSYTTHGICSYGSSAGCEDERAYDAYTRVYYFLDWIEKTTGVTPPAK